MRYLFDKLIAVDGGSQTAGQDVKHVALLLGELFALVDVLAGDVDGDLLGEDGEVVGDDHGAEGTAREALLLVGQASEFWNDQD